MNKDSYERNNLAEKPADAMVRQRLTRAMDDWRKRTADPSVDRARLRMLFEEMDRVMRAGTKYRSNEGYRWNYLDYYRIAE